MQYQLLGENNNNVSPYGDGFVFFYLPSVDKGIIQKDIGETVPFLPTIIQHPFRGKLTTQQINRITMYCKELVLDKKNRVWRKISSNIVAPTTTYLDKKIHIGQSNQGFGTQTKLKITNNLDYTDTSYLGSLVALRKAGLL